MREYPAYGRTIAPMIARGQKPICVAVMLSNGWWHHFNHVPKVCIRADEWALGRFEFGFLHGLHVVAIYGDCGAPQFGELLVELMSAAPARIWAYDLHGMALTPDYDDEQALAMWVHELGAMRVSDRRLQFARTIYAAARGRAELREYEEALKIAERRDGDAAIRWRAQQEENRDRVRRMFSSPFQEASERAAG